MKSVDYLKQELLKLKYFGAACRQRVEKYRGKVAQGNSLSDKVKSGEFWEIKLAETRAAYISVKRKIEDIQK